MITQFSLYVHVHVHGNGTCYIQANIESLLSLKVAIFMKTVELDPSLCNYL